MVSGAQLIDLGLSGPEPPLGLFQFPGGERVAQARQEILDGVHHGIIDVMVFVVVAPEPPTAAVLDAQATL